MKIQLIVLLLIFNCLGAYASEIAGRPAELTDETLPSAVVTQVNIGGSAVYVTSSIE